MGGSEESPVSSAKISLVRSPKHSSTVSKPDLEPSMENHGVQICAGMSARRGSTSSTNSKRSRESSPKMGRPYLRGYCRCVPTPVGCAPPPPAWAQRSGCVPSHRIMPLVDIGYFAHQYKAYRRMAGRRNLRGHVRSRLRLEPIQPFLGRFQYRVHLFQPAGVRDVARADQMHTLELRPLRQMFRRQVRGWWRAK